MISALIRKMSRLENLEVECVESADREIIRVRTPTAHAGVTAALRRAFQAAAEEPTDRDFEALLRRLN